MPQGQRASWLGVPRSKPSSEVKKAGAGWCARLLRRAMAQARRGKRRGAVGIALQLELQRPLQK